MRQIKKKKPGKQNDIKTDNKINYKVRIYGDIIKK